MRGMGQKSARTEARELYSKMGWPVERIAKAVDAPAEKVGEWIHGKPKPRSAGGVISAASREQRAKVKDRACIICRQQAVDPAHLIDRSLCSTGADDPKAVVPLCRKHHRAYDEADIDLLPYLEPHYREELAFAVERVGLLTTLFRVSGDSWIPKEQATA